MIQLLKPPGSAILLSRKFPYEKILFKVFCSIIQFLHRNDKFLLVKTRACSKAAYGSKENDFKMQCLRCKCNKIFKSFCFQKSEKLIYWLVNNESYVPQNFLFFQFPDSGMRCSLRWFKFWLSILTVRKRNNLDSLFVFNFRAIFIREKDSCNKCRLILPLKH